MPDYLVKITLRGESPLEVKKQLRSAFGASVARRSKVTFPDRLPEYYEACRANDHFGCVHWTEDDIENKLRELEIPITPAMIDDIKSSYAVRHIEDRMIERGWEAIVEGIGEAQVK